MELNEGKMQNGTRKLQKDFVHKKKSEKNKTRLRWQIRIPLAKSLQIECGGAIGFVKHWILWIWFTTEFD